MRHAMVPVGRIMPHDLRGVGVKLDSSPLESCVFHVGLDVRCTHLRGVVAFPDRRLYIASAAAYLFQLVFLQLEVVDLSLEVASVVSTDVGGCVRSLV